MSLHSSLRDRVRLSLKNQNRQKTKTVQCQWNGQKTIVEERKCQKEEINVNKEEVSAK